MKNGLDHIIRELICINCKHRFLSLQPATDWLLDLTCPKCGEMKCLINTGEIIDNNTYEKICRANPRINIYREYHLVYQKEDEVNGFI